MSAFGQLIKTRREELRLGLREAAERAGIDPGNLSKIERGRVNPPQDEDMLNRLCRALEYDLAAEEATRLRDTAFAENGRFAPDILSDAAVARRLPLLLRTVHNKQLSEEQLDNLIERMRQA